MGGNYRSASILLSSSARSTTQTKSRRAGCSQSVVRLCVRQNHSHAPLVSLPSSHPATHYYYYYSGGGYALLGEDDHKKQQKPPPPLFRKYKYKAAVSAWKEKN